MAPQFSPGTNYFGKLDANVNISQTNELGYATKADCNGNPNIVALHSGVFNTGCEMIRNDILTGNNVYRQNGTLLSPSWTQEGEGDGDMKKSVYDPTNQAKAMAFKDDLTGLLSTVTHDTTLTGDGTPLNPLHAVGDGIGDMLKATYDPSNIGKEVSFTLTPTGVKTGNYSAQPFEYVPCDLTSGAFTIQLPTAPTDKTVIATKNIINPSGYALELKCGAGDVFNRVGGNTSIYSNVPGDNNYFEYQASTKIWYVTSSAPSNSFATNFPGVDATTPISNTNISINTTTRVLTVVPPLGYFNIFTDGGGIINRFRKTGTITFPAFTDTSGTWYFYFDNTGTAITSQSTWTDFSKVAAIYRILWNKDLFKFTVTSATATLGDTYTNNGSTFTVTQTIAGSTTLYMERTVGTNDPSASGNLVRATGAGTNPIVFSAWNSDAKLVAQYIEYHQNTIPADVHLALHLDGSRWSSGFDMVNNALVSGTPDTSGSNTTIALTTGSVLDDNLPYTVTNNTTGNPFTQDLGNITPASLNATNSALFKVFVQNASSEVSFLPATRFPFAWNAASNRPETISSVGVRTVVPDNRWFVYFIYSTQNPVVGEAIKIVSAPAEFTSLVNAQAYTWTNIQALYPLIGTDHEIRPLYRVIFYNDNSGGGSFPPGCKYSVIRETQDLRAGSVTSTTAATGSLPASSVTTVLYSDITATNMETAKQQLADLRVPYTGATGNVDLGLHNFTVDTNTLFVNATTHTVGIGTTSPTAQLEVKGVVGYWGQLALNSTTTTEQVGFAFLQAGLQRWQMYVPPSTTDYALYNATGNNVPFYIYSTATVNNLVLKGGRVGVGTASPGTAFDIRTNTNSIDGFNIWNTNSGTSAMAGIYFVNNNVSESPTIGYSSSAYTGRGGVNTFILDSSNRDFAIVNASREVARFMNNGNVGIGTNAPTEQVDVVGNLKLSGELKGARESINAGIAGPITTSQYLRGGHNGITMSSTIGWVAMRAGSITGISVAFTTGILQVGATATFSWRINGVDAIVGNAVSLSTTGDKKDYKVQVRNTVGATFVAGDVISCYVTFAGGGTGNASSVLAMGEIVYDN